MSESSTPQGRWLPSWKGAIFVTLPLWILIGVRIFDPMGDRGSVNVFSYVSLVLLFIFWWLWFIVAGGKPWKTRLLVTAIPVAAVWIFFSIFRLDRWSGEMIPTFVLKSTPKSDQTLSTPSSESAGSGAVDILSETPDDFPQFLGPDGRQALDHLRINPDWQSNPPEMLWKQPIGAGWSGFAVRNGFAFTLEQRGDQELVTCYEVESGEPCWSLSYDADFRSTIAGDGPRSTPAIADGVVYTLGAFGKLAAINGADGTPIWQRNLDKEAGIVGSEAKVLPYGRSNSPLVVDDLLIAPLGGPENKYTSLIAVDRHSGETVWTSGDFQISCASPTVATLNDVRQIVSVDAGRVAGYRLDDGEVLWSHPWPGKTEADCNVSQPVPLPPDHVFVSIGYGQGAALLKLTGTSFDVEELWHLPRVLRTKFTNVSMLDGYVYGLSDGILECVEVKTGERQWKRGRYHHGQILRVSNHLVILAEDGEVFLVEASPDEANKVLGSFPAIEGKTWNTFALYGDILIVRNSTEAAAFRLPML